MKKTLKIPTGLNIFSVIARKKFDNFHEHDIALNLFYRFANPYCITEITSHRNINDAPISDWQFLNVSCCRSAVHLDREAWIITKAFIETTLALYTHYIHCYQACIHSTM